MYQDPLSRVRDTQFKRIADLNRKLDEFSKKRNVLSSRWQNPTLVTFILIENYITIDFIANRKKSIFNLIRLLTII